MKLKVTASSFLLQILLITILIFHLFPSYQTYGEKEEKLQEADNRFLRGVEFFNDGEYSAALAEFQWSYNLKPHYAVLYNIAVCYVKLGKYAEALKYFKDYIEKGGSKITPEKKKQVDDEIAYVKSLTGNLNVATNIDGAAIIIDGKEVGKTPLKESIPVSAGTHLLEVALMGYMPVKEEITIATGTTIEKSYILTKDIRTAQVTITSTAPHSTVLIDGREMGKSPWSGKVSVGEHEIIIKAPGYRDEKRQVVLHPDEEREIEVDMEISGKPGKITINSNIQGADVFLEQQNIGMIPLKSHKVPAGIYHLSISKEGYKSWEGDISVREGGHTKVELKMDKLSGKFSPVYFSISTGIAIAAGVAGATLGYFALQKEKEFNDFPDHLKEQGTGDMAALQEKYNNLAEEGKKLSKAADICIAIAGVTGVTSIFLAFFTQFKKPESKATINISATSGLSINSTWRF